MSAKDSQCKKIMVVQAAGNCLFHFLESIFRSDTKISIESQAQTIGSIKFSLEFKTNEIIQLNLTKCF